jgi:RNA polymerase sigma-70 factor (ECF subfamily)
MTGKEAFMLAAARSGDREAFDALYRRFRPLVFRAAFRITGDAHEAEDVVQETFLQVHEALPQWRPEARLSTWIWRIAVNKALDERRRAKRRPAVAGELPEPAAAEVAQPDATVAERIRAAIEALPPRERAVFVLRHYEDLPLAEVAEVLEVAVGTVKAALHHALVKLSGKLRDLR